MPVPNHSFYLSSAPPKDTLRDVLALGVTVVLPPDVVAWRLPPPPVEVIEEEPDPKAKAKAKGKAKPGKDKVEEEAPPEVVEPPADPFSEENLQTFPLSVALAAIAKEPVSLGFLNGKECFTSLDPAQCSLSYTVGLPVPPPPPEPEKKRGRQPKKPPTPPPEPEGPAEPEFPLDVVPEGWTVRDIGEGTCDHLQKMLRRNRGVLWNGALVRCGR